MKKTLSLTVVLCAAFVLAACGNSSSTPSTTTWSIATGAQELFTTKVCNSYIHVMQCVIEKSPDSIKTQTQQSLDEIVSLWKTLTPEQTEKACDAAYKVLETQKEQLATMWCTL